MLTLCLQHTFFNCGMVGSQIVSHGFLKKPQLLPGQQYLQFFSGGLAGFFTSLFSRVGRYNVFFCNSWIF